MNKIYPNGKEKLMQVYMRIVLVLSILACGNVFAQTDIAGTWQGKLIIDKNNTMTIQFILAKKADGSYSAVLNSPDTGAIKNVAASAVKYSAGKLTIDVASLSGSYSGTVGKGAITGEWKQQGSTLPLVLTPYKKPDAGSLKPLVGEWVSILKVTDAMTLTVVFHFQYSKDGKFIATFDQPNEGVKGLAITDVSLENDQVSFKIPVASGEYTGKLSGSSIAGVYKVSGTELPMNLVKGKYKAPDINMPVEDMNKLLGQWAGRMDVPGDVIHTIILRFEKNKEGKLAALVECPERGTTSNKLTDVLLKGDQLSFKIPASRAEYTGKLKNNSISGIYKAGEKQYELIMTKGAKYEAQTAQVDIPAEEMKKLLGQWKGNISSVSLVFRFERTAAGKNVILIDLLEQSIKGMPVLKATLVDGNLWLKMSGSEYNGKLIGNRIDGALKVIDQGNITVPLPLTKE
jgi:hypothetical protein